MIEKVIYYSFKGRFFEEKATWGIFERTIPNQRPTFDARISLIYGRNGTGKSTFSESLRSYQATSLEFSETQFFDSSNNVLPINKDSIYVFNESFIDSDVRSKNDAINAIIMLGEAGKIQDEIDLQTKTINDSLARQNGINLSKYSEPKNPLNLQNLEKSCRDALNNSTWAREEAQIEGKDVVRATTNKVEELHKIKLSANDTQKSVRAEFELKWNQYNKVKGSTERIPSLPISFDYGIFFSRAILLLKTTISRPISTGLEDKILEEIRQNQFSEDLSKRKSLFSEEKTQECPYCFQPISEAKKISIVEAINHVLNNEVTNYQHDLENIRFPNPQGPFELPFQYDGKISSQTLSALRTSAQTMATRTDALYKILKQKLSNPFDQVDLQEFTSITQECASYETARQSAENEIAQFNKAIDEKEILLNEVRELHQKLGKYEIEASYKTLDSARKLQADETAQFQKEQAIVQEAKAKLAEANQKRQHADIAANEINKVLTNIFLSPTRLFLKEVEDNPNLYYVFSHGKHIKCKDLSTGERNLIGLVYFILKTQANQTKESEFSKEMLMVLDDPVSSFDNENKVQVYKYVFDVALRMLKGNSSSKIIILSHQYETIASLSRLFSNYKATNPADFNNKKDLLPLIKQIKQDHSLETITKDGNFNDYKYLLGDCFEAAEDRDDAVSKYYPLNQMRRILEAYSTFKYQCGLGDLLCDPKIINQIPDENLRKQYPDLSIYISLNGGSHGETATQQLAEQSTLDLEDPEAQKNVLRKTFCYLYAIDPVHIEKTLSDFPDAINTIKQWQVELGLVKAE